MALPSSVNKAFSQLKTNSTSTVFEALIEIRRFLSKNESNVKIVREKFGLNDLVHILGKPNEKNLDITLSILGNCCVEIESREEASRHGVVRAVVTVLNSASRDSIQGRACRLISNLALTYSIAVELHQENVVGSLVSIIDKEGKNSIASRQMAVRALRNLWVVECERGTMLGLNMVHKVTVLLTTPYEKKEQRELLKAVLKALAVFTKDCSEACASQVHAGDSGFRSLLTLSSHREIKEVIILCVYNLCHVGSSRPILGNAGAVNVIIKELSREATYKTEPTDNEFSLVSALCLLCREAVNRAKIRRRGGLRIILSVFRDSPNCSLQASSLHGLIQFIYDELSLDELLKEGMVNVLVEKLNNIVKNNGCEHEVVQKNKSLSSSSPPKKRRNTSPVCHIFSDSSSAKEAKNANDGSAPNDESSVSCNSESWKRFRASSPSYQAVLQEISGSQSYILRNRDRINSTASPAYSSDSAYQSSSDYCPAGECSPGSSHSMCFSPHSSPPYSRQRSTSPVYSPAISSPSFDVFSSTSSPASQSSGSDDLADVLYSPVCQDALSDEEITCGVPNCNLAASDEFGVDSDLITDMFQLDYGDSPPSPGVLSPMAAAEPQNEEDKLLLLLSSVSHMDTVVEDLAGNNTLLTLLDYERLMRKPLPRAWRILTRIIRASHYFLQVLTHQFALNVYSSLCDRLHASCMKCDYLYNLGNNMLVQLSIVAETGFGEGELSYHLQKADDAFREKLAVSIPYIVRSPRVLRKLLVSCKGLDILQQLLKPHPDVESSLFKYIPTGLALLAESLQIYSPKLNAILVDENNSAMNDLHICDDDSMDSIVFLLDNGDTVSANRDLLCRCSPVFEAMLQGHFRESREETIRLQDVSIETFTNLIKVMKLGKVPSHLSNTSLSSAMELLLVLDRYLLPGVEDFPDLIVRQFLHPGSIYDMYVNAYSNMGRLKQFDEIRLHTVQFLLTSDMNMNQRSCILTKLLEEPCSDQVQSDIFSTLREKLEITHLL